MNENFLSTAFGWVASVAFLAYFVVLFARGIKRKRVCLLLSLLVSIFSWRMSYVLRVHPLVWPDLFENFVESIKIFAVDSSYKQFFVNTRYAMENIPLIRYINAYVYIPFLYFLAPVTGAVAILEIVSSLSERLNLVFKSSCFWKEVYYFSELNEQSLALAESARKSKPFLLEPVIVFTDAYFDESNERSSELYYAAKNCGAICLKDDILHINIRKICKRKIVLIDSDEMKNIQCMMSLLDAAKSKMFKTWALSGAEIVVCADNMTYSLVIEKIKQKAAAIFGKYDVGSKIVGKLFKKDSIIYKKLMKLFEKRSMLFVNVYSNMVKNLFKEMPLYEPLVDEEKGKEFNLTILGTGQIGTELFLSAYWCGQMIGHKLNINVISRESEASFIDKINFINPEIFDTVERCIANNDAHNIPARELFSESGSDSAKTRTKAYEKMMKKYWFKDVLAEPYLNFRYYQTDIEDDNLSHKLSETHWADNFKLCETDYFVVALGDDSSNIRVAEKLNKYINEYKLTNGLVTSRNTVIACAVYNSSASRIINESQDNQTKNLKTFMYAFGSFDEVFSLENMLMSSERERSNMILKSYHSLKSGFEKDEFKAEAKSKAEGRTEYDFWANIARALHTRYKAFSAGAITDSVFTVAKDDCNDKTKDYDKVEDKRKGKTKDKESKTLIEKRNETYAEAFKDYDKKVSDTEDKEGIIKKLTWLEHRRWCAFTRVRGFTRAEDFKQYFHYTGNHKEMELKLHPFLVESDLDNQVENIFTATAEELDCLDSVNRSISDYVLELSKKTISALDENETKALHDELNNYIKKSTDYNKSFDRPPVEEKNDGVKVSEKRVYNCEELFEKRKCSKCSGDVVLYVMPEKSSSKVVFWAVCNGCGKKTEPTEFCYHAIKSWDKLN